MSTSYFTDLAQQYIDGKSVAELALEMGIPMERIAQRIRVAAEYTSTHQLTLQTAPAKFDRVL